MSTFRDLLMIRKHKGHQEYVKLTPEILEFKDQDSTKDLTIESNADWSIGVTYNNF